MLQETMKEEARETVVPAHQTIPGTEQEEIMETIEVRIGIAVGGTTTTTAVRSEEAISTSQVVHHLHVVDRAMIIVQEIVAQIATMAGGEAVHAHHAAIVVG